MNTVFNELVGFLKKVADDINKLEDEAKHALYKRKDQPTYEAKLQLKAEKLHKLLEDTDEYIKKLPQGMQSMFRDRIGGFSYSAEKALKLNSIFYMSALLYPEDHHEEAPNDLENFIAELEAL